MYRTRQYRRDIRNRKIARKKKLCRALYWTSIGGQENPGAWYKHDGQYSKGKIHCSCKACTFGKHFGLPTLRDERESSKFKSELSDYYN